MKRILIIDDSATVRMYHRNILEGAGYAADEGINGMEALEKALATPYDLYLVDVNMPKLDGYCFVRELRSHTAIAQVPAIMISTEAESIDRTKAYVAGANLYIVKPTRPDILLPYVRLLLGERSI
jgi:two-component system chemotaxis response regulator CheY